MVTNQFSFFRRDSVWVVRFYDLIISLFYWNVLIRIFVFLRFIGQGDGDFFTFTPKSLSLFRDNILGATLVVSLVAIFYWFFENYLVARILRRFSGIGSLLIRTLIFVVVFTMMSYMLGIFYYSADKGLSFQKTISHTFLFITSPVTYYFFFIGLFTAYIITLIRSLQWRIGNRAWRIISGYYLRPREEDRIFLFIDLVSSTKVAEKLGHVQYSCFLQDCFSIMGNAMIRTHGGIYQYVGDEAVLTWSAKRSSNFTLAADFYFIFHEDLEQKREFFKKKYGIYPSFTASLHRGIVMVAEVGVTRRDIAYHGDVVNTSSRVQKVCKIYNKPLLATEKFMKGLNESDHGFASAFVDDVILTGKKRRVKIFSIDAACNDDSCQIIR